MDLSQPSHTQNRDWACNFDAETTTFFGHGQIAEEAKYFHKKLLPNLAISEQFSGNTYVGQAHPVLSSVLSSPRLPIAQFFISADAFAKGGVLACRHGRCESTKSASKHRHGWGTTPSECLPKWSVHLADAQSSLTIVRHDHLQSIPQLPAPFFNFLSSSTIHTNAVDSS
jgi:hypothetical protein